MGIVVLGVSGVKPAGEGVLGYPYCYGFQSLGVGVLLALVGYELAPV
jgi:hypothetical protein